MYLYILLLFISLTSCANFYEIKGSSINYNKPTIVDNNYDISGRFTIKQTNKNAYGNFTWLKKDNYQELSFNTPLGQTIARVTINNKDISLKTKDKILNQEDLNQIMLEEFGFIIPLNYLSYWVQGLPIPETEITQKISQGFIQLGWRIEYLEWQDINHPRIIQISQQENIIKFLIKW